MYKGRGRNKRGRFAGYPRGYFARRFLGHFASRFASRFIDYNKIIKDYTKKCFVYRQLGC
jgi:hypothetical protein